MKRVTVAALKAEQQQFEQFLQRFAIHRNGARAARESGVDPSAASAAAARWLARPDAQEYLDRMHIASYDSNMMELSELRARATEIARGSRVVKDVRINSDGEEIITYVETQEKTENINKALEITGKILGAFTDNVKKDVTVRVVVEDEKLDE